MSIERQMQAISILQEGHEYDLDFRMSLKIRTLEVTNLVQIDTYDIESLYQLGFIVSIYTNLGTFDTDNYGFHLHIIDIKS